MSVRRIVALITICSAAAASAGAAAAPAPPRLVLVRQHPTPVLTRRAPGAEAVRYGFEGGRVVKVDGTYHLFTSEMAGDPIWVRMRFGHWTSRDRLSWTRHATVRESSGEFEGKDPRAALWSPLPVWDPGEGRWNLFYVAYRAKASDGTRFLLNHDGEIWRAVSRTKGEKGIDGPFDDVGVVMRPGADSLPWEGLQGTDSFFPWPLWRALARALRQCLDADKADPALASGTGGRGHPRRPVAPRARGEPRADRGAIHREPDRDGAAGRRVHRGL